MGRLATHSGLSADAIEKGTRFGWWEVTDPTVERRNTAEMDLPWKTPRYAFVRCRCTACGQTEKLVRVTYLLNGKSTSCCQRGPARHDRNDE